MGEALRVLFAEDREDDAVLVQLELRRAGYQLQCTRVETRETMQQELERGEWDMIISDYAMPQFDAVAALNVLKESGLDLPFIIVSGTVGEDTAVHALKHGAHDFIPKTNLKRLVPAVARELREAAGRRARRHTEEHLRTSMQTIAALFTASPAPIVVLDPETVVLRWNPAAERLFGWSAAEVVGTRAPMVPASDNDSFRERIRCVLEGEPVPTAEVPRTCKDGRELRVVVSSARLVDGNNRATGVMDIFVDVTEQRALEEQFRQAQKMEAVGRLAGGIAHDFNNVLTAIHGYASLLISDMPAEDERRDDVQEILNAADRAAVFTRQLLTFSRKQVVQPALTDLNVVVRELEKMLARLINTHVTLVVELSATPAVVFADKGQIEQCVTNLVVNARDAMDGCAGGQIRLRTFCVNVGAEDAVRHRGVEPGEFCVIEVADAGSGIDPELVDRIFEPFFTTKDVGKGTGLGLSTVYGIARQNRGFVRVSSVPGKGSIFSLLLPKVDGEPAAAVAESAEPATPVGQGVILVVEDEPAVRHLVVRVLEREGYRVLAAANSEEALELVKTQPNLDLMLTDIMLPQMNGKELARRVLESHPKIAIVYMSGYANEEIDLHSAYLEKPFTPRELLSKVREELTVARA